MYNIEVDNDLMEVSFGTPGTNAEIVKYVHNLLKEKNAKGEIPGGSLIKITGPASIPVTVVLVSFLQGLYGTIAVFDPKLGKFVISLSRSPKYALGDLID